MDPSLTQYKSRLVFLQVAEQLHHWSIDQLIVRLIKTFIPDRTEIFQDKVPVTVFGISGRDIHQNTVKAIFPVNTHCVEISPILLINGLVGLFFCHCRIAGYLFNHHPDDDIEIHRVWFFQHEGAVHIRNSHAVLNGDKSRTGLIRDRFNEIDNGGLGRAFIPLIQGIVCNCIIMSFRLRTAKANDGNCRKD